MTPTKQGSVRFFEFSGITVFVHWSWFAVALFSFQNRSAVYSSPVWNIYEYLGLFAIVLMHEFGHSLACRQTGGSADQIVLWPLGGVAYVSPPPRPGATLWSIAAGPLVNVGLLPVLFLAKKYVILNPAIPDDVVRLVATLQIINLGILIFNLLPIFPLDGGQILRALLWFWVGPVRSLLIATSIGFVGAAGLVGLAIWQESIWLGIMAGFVFLNCRGAWLYAKAMSDRTNYR